MSKYREKVKNLLSESKCSRRKTTLFACACVRQVWHLLTDDRSKKAIEAAEDYVDGSISLKKLQTATVAAATYAAADAATYATDAATYDAAADATRKKQETRQIVLLQEIINPGKHPEIRLQNNTKTIQALAERCYLGDWGLAPLLADALEETGCDDHEIMNHLRGPNTHVKGCWAVDLILGKE